LAEEEATRQEPLHPILFDDGLASIKESVSIRQEKIGGLMLKIAEMTGEAFVFTW
jgi:hypothetical protein